RRGFCWQSPRALGIESAKLGTGWPLKGLDSALFAGVAELVDELDLGCSAARRGGSNPSARTMPEARQTKGLDDAGHGYKRGWTEARIEDPGSRSGSRKQTRR